MTIDNVIENGISSQICEMAQTALLDVEGDGNEYALAINLSERSFYKSLDRERSLYAHYQLFDPNGECVLEKFFCSQGKKTLASALTQKAQIARLAKELKQFFLSGKKNVAK